MRKKYFFKNLDELLAYFQPAGEPVKTKEFEQMCASLCDVMGLTVKQRPKADGSGVKIELFFDGEQGTILCLCYRPDVQVGRSELSNLAKENPEVNANHMVVMTTSTFSPGAQAYAQGTGMRTVSGEQVLGLMRKHGLIQELPKKPIKTEEPEIKDLREKKVRVEKPVEVVPEVVTKSPLAARADVQAKKPASQRFDAREYMRNGRKQVKPIR